MHQAVRLESRKWPDRPHWEFDGCRLGEDEHGVWIGLPVSTVLARPGARFVTDQPQATLVPREAGYVATFHLRPGETSPVRTYVDITTVPVWQDATVTMVDLDLDVIQDWAGRVWVDDEDEFADHQVRFGYPADLVQHALTTCATVRATVEAGHPPYDDTSPAHWLAMLDEQSVAREVVVHGLVQGVFFRDSCRREAEAAGVAGWARNEPDGTVRAFFEGPPDAVDRLVAWAHDGPPHAQVDRVDVREARPSGATGFTAR